MKKTTIAIVLATAMLFTSTASVCGKTIDYYNRDGSHTRVEYNTDDNGNTTVRSYDVPKTNPTVAFLKIVGVGIMCLILGGLANSTTE